MLEALALRVPVVACENGTRPAGVLTYPAEDPERLAAGVEHVLDHRVDLVAGMQQLDVVDTLADEVALLTNAAFPSVDARGGRGLQWQ